MKVPTVRVPNIAGHPLCARVLKVDFVILVPRCFDLFDGVHHVFGNVNCVVKVKPTSQLGGVHRLVDCLVQARVTATQFPSKFAPASPRDLLEVFFVLGASVAVMQNRVLRLTCDIPCAVFQSLELVIVHGGNRVRQQPFVHFGDV